GAITCPCAAMTDRVQPTIAVHHETKRIRLLLSAVENRWLLHRRDHLGATNRAVVEILIPTLHVFDRSLDAAIASLLEVRHRRRPASAIARRVAGRAVGDH